MLKSFSLLIEIDVEIKVRTTRRQALISVFKDTTPLKQFLTDYVVDIFARLILLFLDDNKRLLQFSSVAQSCPTLHTPWTTACQASLSITKSWSLPRFMSIESVMASKHLIFCCPLLLLYSIFPSIRVFSNEFSIKKKKIHP